MQAESDTIGIPDADAEHAPVEWVNVIGDDVEIAPDQTPEPDVEEPDVEAAVRRLEERR